MIEAKKRELNQQLAELEDDGTSSEQSFEGFYLVKKSFEIQKWFY